MYDGETLVLEPEVWGWSFSCGEKLRRLVIKA